MKADANSFRKYKIDKERELSQLKKQEKKSQIEIKKLKMDNNQQADTLKLKNEEIARIQKKLRESSENQRQVKQKKQKAFESSPQGHKLRTWVTQEIEVKVAIEEAHINLNQLTFFQERRDMAAQLDELMRMSQEYADHDDNEDESDVSSSRPKRKRYDMNVTYVQQSRAELKRELELEIKRVEDQIECKNVQINEAQQMVIENDDDIAKRMLNNIHDLLDAKMILKHLYSSSVQYLLDFKLKQAQYETTTNALNNELNKYKKKTESLEGEINRTITYKKKPKEVAATTAAIKRFSTLKSNNLNLITSKIN
jgi:kinesin family protein 4/21/27